MYSLAWLVVVGVIGAVLGGWLGHLVAQVRSKAAERIQELEAELESARGEISGYRREVFDQFAETARKFRSLDESYHDLHRQLAESASLLCGEAAGPLLEAPASQTALPIEETPEPAAQVPDASAEEPDEIDEQSEELVEEHAEDDGVPILVAEVSEPAPANDESASEVEPEPRRADTAG